MGSFGRKLKRDKKKPVIKKAVKVASSIVAAERKGRMLAKLNTRRITEYCNAFLYPSIAYVMKQQFSWTVGQLEKLEKAIGHLDGIFQAGFRDGKTYIDLEGLWIGLEDECKIQYKKHERGKPDDDTSYESWMASYAKNLSLAALEYTETLWLWALHDSFGFGKKRLEKAMLDFKKLNPLEMPVKMLEHIMQFIEEMRGREGKRITFDWARKTLEKLDVKGDKFQDGLVLLRRAA